MTRPDERGWPTAHDTHRRRATRVVGCRSRLEIFRKAGHYRLGTAAQRARVTLERAARPALPASPESVPRSAADCCVRGRECPRQTPGASVDSRQLGRLMATGGVHVDHLGKLVQDEE